MITGSDRSSLSCTYAFIRATGELIWKQDKAAFESDLLNIGRSAIGRRWNGDLVALDLANGNVRWTVVPQAYTYKFREDDSPVMKDDVIYFGGVDGYLYAVDGLQGQVIWKRDVGSRITTTPAADADNVYVGTVDHDLFQISRRDGSVATEKHCSGRPFGRLILTEESLIVLIDQLELVAYDHALKEIRWTQVGKPRWSSHQPVIWRGAVVVGTPSGEVAAFDPSDGSEVLSLSVDGMVRGLGAAGDILFIGTYGGSIYAYEWKDG